MNTTKDKQFRRPLTDQLVEQVRALISEGRVQAGAFLPTERELGSEHGVSRVTVRRALAQLVEEGLLESVPYQGYRLLPSPRKDSAKRTVAYVLGAVGPDEAWDRSHGQILSAFSRVQMSTGNQMLGVGGKGRKPHQVFQDLRESGVWGVVLDTSLPGYLEAAFESRLPLVMVDAYVEHPQLDVVVQDNFSGAWQAVDHLLQAGHKRIGWVGPTVVKHQDRAQFFKGHEKSARAGWKGFIHYRERFAGARSAMHEAGLDFTKAYLGEVSKNDDDEDAERIVTKMLKQSSRPTALACMWLEMGLGATRAIQNMGLQIGRDIELAVWCTENEYREILALEFLGGQVPLAVVWKPADMAEVALQRLEVRATRPQSPACRVLVKSVLIPPQSAEAALKKGIHFSK